MLIDRRLIAQFDFAFLGVMYLICAVGLVVLYSAGYDPDYSGFTIQWLNLSFQSQAFVKQLIFICLGTCALIAGACLSPAALSRGAYFFYSICVFMLVCVDIIGAVAKGSQRWLSFGGFNIQPSEPMKLALILALSRYLSRNPPREGGYRFKEIIIPFLMFLVPAALVMGQPDLGTALVIISVGFSLVIFMGIRPKVLVLLFLPLVIGAYPAWNSLHDYQKRRVQVLIDPEADPKGSGYHITQSKIAVGSGSVFGKGYMKGTQTQLEFLPEHTTDFIFSVLAEEWGFFGCMIVLSLYLLFLYRMLRVVARTRDLFFALIAFGITTLLFVHIFINIGMVIGLLPVVGLPLPLFSYGGSSALSCMFSIGIVLGLDMRRLIFISRG